ncbi:MAG TPA: hypothetical protein VKX46_11080, partial [Ktedonobacteraceae bacterium]|nr:hypothetical protein [Ktedonobacteraceae bacterium]
MQQHRTRFGHIVFVALLTLSMLLLTVVVDVRPAAAAGFTWSLGSDTATTQFNNVDINPGIFHDGSDLWMLYSDGYNWHRWKGTTMDNLVEQSNGSCGYSACLDSSFNQPYGDDRYWIGGTWVDTSTSPHTWYATVHVEFKYNSLNSGQGNLGYDHFRRIQLATSTDNGATWHDQGDILTSDNSYTMSDYGNYFDFGTGDQTLYVDTTGGYFYVFYWHVW